jgi:hypothetical protein
MANAAIYNLLSFDDKDQDKYLIDNAKLLNNLNIIKQNNITNLNAELFMLRKQYLELTNSLIKIVDTVEFNIKKDELNKLGDYIKYKTDNFNDLIKPSLEDMQNSHFLFMNNQYKPFVESSHGYSKVTVNTKPLFGGEILFTVPSDGHFISDMVLHIQLSELTPKNVNDKVRYADYLGHKLIKNVQFIINNNIIDEYSGEYYNVHFNNIVPENKKKAWLSCIGQETPIDAILLQDPINSDYKERRVLFNGNQTIKSRHGVVELFIPLLFWFNIHQKSCLLNNYPEGNVKIKVNFEESTKLMTCVDVVNDIYHENYNTPVFNECELYINNIYINDDIVDIFISKLGFSLIRTHKCIEVLLNLNRDDISLSDELKFPVEDVTFYARPVENENGIDSLDTWHRNAVLNLVNIKTPVIYKSAGIDTLGINNIKFYEEASIFNSFKLSVNGGSTHGTDVSLFYQSYLPYAAGKNITGNNNHTYFISYNLFPKEYQPSGYVNMTKSRDIYFSYSSNLIENHTPVKLYLHATAINFLVYNNVTACLNFAK